MINHKKFTKLTLSGILILLLLLISNISTNYQKESESENKITTNNNAIPKAAWIWDLTGSPIFIDDTDPNYNWSKTAADNPWCYGLGTSSNPYVIHDIKIIGDGTYNGITVINSNVHFRIEYNVIYNEKVVLNNKGIYFNNVVNGSIINNHIYSDLNGVGIELVKCEDILTGGNLIESQHWGLYLFKTNNSIINHETIINNKYGIELTASSDNEITWSDIKNNSMIGIDINQESNSNKIRFNNISENVRDGLRLWIRCDNNEVKNNEFTRNDRDIIEGLSCAGNSFNDNGDYSFYEFDDTTPDTPISSRIGDDDDDVKEVKKELININQFRFMFFGGLIFIFGIIGYILVKPWYLNKRDDNSRRKAKSKYGFETETQKEMSQKNKGSTHYRNGFEPRFEWGSLAPIPSWAQNYINQQKDNSGRIPFEFLSENVKKAGFEYCTFFLEDGNLKVRGFKRR